MTPAGSDGPLAPASLEELRPHVGRELGASGWRLVTQEDVDDFARVTGDDYWIHTDAERARQSLFGGTVAHGYLTLSLAAAMTYEVLSTSSEREEPWRRSSASARAESSGRART